MKYIEPTYLNFKYSSVNIGTINRPCIIQRGYMYILIKRYYHESSLYRAYIDDLIDYINNI